MTETTQVPAAAQNAVETPPAESKPVAEIQPANVSGAEWLAAKLRQASAPKPTATAALAPDQTATETKPETAAEAETQPPEAGVEPAGETSPPASDAPAEEPVSDAASSSDETEPDAPKGETETVTAMKARIDKLTAKLREAERKLEAGAKPEVETPKKPVPVPLEDHFAHDAEIKKINQRIGEIRAGMNWLELNPDGGEVLDEKGQVVLTLTPEQARNARNAFSDERAELIANRRVRQSELEREDRQMRTHFDSQVEQKFTWAKDPESEQNKLIAEFVARVPEIQRLPTWRMIAAHAVEGILQAQTAPTVPAAKPAAKPVPKVAPVGGAAAPRRSQTEKALAEAEAAYERSGRGNDYKRVMQLRAELARERGTGRR